MNSDSEIIFSARNLNTAVSEMFIRNRIIVKLVIDSLENLHILIAVFVLYCNGKYSGKDSRNCEEFRQNRA